MSSRFDCWLQHDIDITVCDDVILSLTDILMCPIKLNLSPSMCIFNSHSCKYSSFDHLRMMAHERNTKYQERGYRNGLNAFSDPRTGEDFDYNHEMNNLYHRMLVKPQYPHWITTNFIVECIIYMLTNKTNGICESPRITTKVILTHSKFGFTQSLRIIFAVSLLFFIHTILKNSNLCSYRDSVAL